ncbi:MAG: 3D-(3,5/4)-trihydroxycyclohexane-1,2-dione acylhydrolase (decyclizing) [Eubacterium sp.]|nr:3D-(3,5/4)-trihydroxycyclohexane-1,2-dione acylhydrolase (decyclizing) [Eubacterium sp.]
MKRERLTMSQALVKFLDNQYVEFDGVETKFVSGIFGIFGHGCVVGVGQALEQGGHNLRFYQGKNEQNMALAAVAYAKQMDRRAIIPCVSSIGPGATNMVTACGCATANRIPLLVLPGDTFACRQPDPVLQQAEFFDNYGRTVTDAFRGVCHYFDRIERPEQLMTACINAMRVLTDPADTGAVCLAMPQDVEGEAYDYPEHFLQKRVWHIDRRPIALTQLERAVKLIKSAKKPIIVCGGGVRYSAAEEELLRLAVAHNIPITETQAGKGIIDWKHPLNLGGIGVTGGKAANVIARDADIVIGVGTRFTDFTTSSKWLFNENRKVLGINICPFDAYKMDAEAVTADAREAIVAIDEALGDYKTAYAGEIAAAKTEWDAIVDEFYTKELDGGLSQTRALGIINEFMAESDIALGSAGSLPGDMQRLFRPGSRGTYHMEYGYSNMGYEINGALGAKLAQPDREVYTFCGDGSFLMGHSELYTSLQEGLKINVCVFDNLGWGCIENLQNNQGTDTFGTVFRARNPVTGMLDGEDMTVDFAKIAEGYGAKGYSIHNSEELKAALEDAKKQTKSVVFDIKVMPKTMTPGFESWWRVGVAEVSKSATVAAAYKDMQENIAKTFDY